MAVLLVMGLLSLLMHGTDAGCLKWRMSGDDVCCDICKPGNRLVTECGPNPEKLCTLCDPGTFVLNSHSYKCTRCSQCVGAQVHVKDCTATSDTQCGCKEGLTCGDDHCSFCVKKCAKGQEPAEKLGCRPCPKGTFNDQIHEKCRPWSTGCPNPDEKIVTEGDASSDIKCANVSIAPSTRPKKPADDREPAWPLVLALVPTVALLSGISIIFVIILVKKRNEKERKKKPIPKTPIIRTPTDDPRTLIAIECSFHEAQQEQGSSSESLDSRDSSEQLIA